MLWICFFYLLGICHALPHVSKSFGVDKRGNIKSCCYSIEHGESIGHHSQPNATLRHLDDQLQQASIALNEKVSTIQKCLWNIKHSEHELHTGFFNEYRHFYLERAHVDIVDVLRAIKEEREHKVAPDHEQRQWITEIALNKTNPTSPQELLEHFRWFYHDHPSLVLFDSVSAARIEADLHVNLVNEFLTFYKAQSSKLVDFLFHHTKSSSVFPSVQFHKLPQHGDTAIEAREAILQLFGFARQVFQDMDAEIHRLHTEMSNILLSSRSFVRNDLAASVKHCRSLEINMRIHIKAEKDNLELSFPIYLDETARQEAREQLDRQLAEQWLDSLREWAADERVQMLMQSASPANDKEWTDRMTEVTVAWSKKWDGQLEILKQRFEGAHKYFGIE